VCALAPLLLGFDCDYGGSSGRVALSELPDDVAVDPDQLLDVIAVFQHSAYPILRDHCSECHAGSGPGSPAIAHGDVQAAYSAVVNSQKVNLSSPGSSRLVRRLAADLHYCWGSCAENAAEMELAIAAWAEAVTLFGETQLEESIASEPLTLADGFEDEGNLRFRAAEIATWEFKEGSGAVAHDTSGVPPAMDLTLEGARWMSNYGLAIEEPDDIAIASRSSGRKLYELLAKPGAGTQQYSLEAWVTPANTTQEGPARIVTFSSNPTDSNFTLGQVLYTYDFRNRSLAAGIYYNGEPSLRTYDADQDLQATLQHVVLTYDQYRGRRIYVNGVFTDDVDAHGGDRLWNWSREQSFVIGNERTRERPWLGQVRFVAVHALALSEEEILRNFDAGVGKRLKMLFDVSAWAGPGAFVEFVVSELDDASYLFCEPTFVTPAPNGFRVANLQIAVNGVVAAAGQAFTNVDAAIGEPRQRLSTQCAVIAKDRGPELDEFTIDFEVLSGFATGEEDEVVIPPPIGGVVEDLPLEGVRDFARIRDTMAALTGVDPTSPGVRDTFLELEQQLPGTFDLRAFQSSHQVGISKLALEYCHDMVDSPALRVRFFGPAFEFESPVATAFSSQAKRDLVIGALVDRLVGVGIANQPGPADLDPVLNGLIDDLTQVCATSVCGAERTRTIVKAACSAVLSSAALTVH
jgi:hypothetical protein